MNQDIIDENNVRLVYTSADVRKLIAIAVAAERAACAAIAARCHAGYYNTHYAVRAIRARKWRS